MTCNDLLGISTVLKALFFFFMTLFNTLLRVERKALEPLCRGVQAHLVAQPINTSVASRASW